MPGLGLRKRMIINTLSNYGKMVLGIMITIFLTRLLFLGLTSEEYGFWALLWSIFGYSLLLDFGFGAAIQKHTSEVVVNEDWDRYNRLVSTVLFNYLSLAGIIAIATVVLGLGLPHLFKFSPQNQQYFRDVLFMFGIGSAIVFPTGFYTEIMRGMQEIHTRNIIQTAFMVINFVALYLVLNTPFTLKAMTIVTIATNLMSNIVMAWFCHRKLPHLHIRIKYYDKKLLKGVIGFSLYAYIITFSNLLIFRTDQLVISIFAGVSFVAVYQIASRLAETYRQFASQFLDNLSPIAAQLFAAGNKNKMAEIMVQSNRIMGMISTLMLIPLIVFVKPLLKIWLELEDTAGIVCSLILLVSMYVLLFFRSSSVYILLMANEHRRLTIVAVLECLANLVLSIVLVMTMDPILQYFGVHLPNANIIGVAVGTILPNIFFAFAFNIPVACRFCEITWGDFFKQSVNRSLFIGVLTLAFAYLLKFIHYPSNIWVILLYCFIITIFYAVLYYLIGLVAWEKQQLKGFIATKLAKKSM